MWEMRQIGQRRVLFLVLIICISHMVAILGFIPREVRHTAQAMFPIHSALEDEDSVDGFFDFEYKSGVVRAKKRNGQYKLKDNRDSLPFEVFLEGQGMRKDKKEQIGVYFLDSSCARGDLIELGGFMYVVKRVAFIYKWERMGLRVVRKKIDVEREKGENMFVLEDMLQ